MTKAWIIHGECGDYYCGCGHGHVIGVTTNYDEIPGLIASAESMEHAYGVGATRWYRDYVVGSIKVEELELGLVYPRDAGDHHRNNQNTDRTQRVEVGPET